MEGGGGDVVRTPLFPLLSFVSCRFISDFFFPLIGYSKDIGWFPAGHCSSRNPGLGGTPALDYFVVGSTLNRFQAGRVVQTTVKIPALGVTRFKADSAVNRFKAGVVVFVVVVSHSPRIGCQPEKNYFTRWPIPLVVC